MAIAFRAVAFGDFEAATRSPTVSKPTGTVDNDLLIMWTATDTAHVPTTPAGWTLIATLDQSTDTTVSAYYKIAASEGASYTFTNLFSTTEVGTIAIMAYSGVDTTTPLDGVTPTTLASAAANGQTWPAITPATTAAMVVGIGGSDPSSSGRAATPSASPTGQTERVDHTETPNSINGWVYALEKQLAGAPAATALAITCDGGGSNTMVKFSIALRPAGGSTTFNQSLTATSVAVTGTMTRSVGKPLTATAVAASASMVKQVNKPLTATTVAVTATLTAIKVKMLTMAATVVVTGSMVKSVGKGLTATTVAVTGSMVRSVAKTLTGTSVAVTGSMLAQKAKLLTMSATVAVTGTMTRSIGKTLTAAPVAVTATITRNIAKALTASPVAATATMSRTAGKTLAATAVAVTATMTRRTNKALSASVTVTASIVKTVGKTLTATVTTIASLIADFISGSAVIFTRFFDPPGPSGGSSGNATATKYDAPDPDGGSSGTAAAPKYDPPNPSQS